MSCRPSTSPVRPSVSGVLFTFALCLVVAQLRGQLTDIALPIADDCLVRTWAIEDGLRGNTITDLAQSSDGYLWTVTTRGIGKFDGQQFTVQPDLGYEWIRNHQLGAIHAARDGTVWVGRARGVIVRISNGCPQTIIDVPPDKEPNTWISSFAETPDGAIWFSQGGNVRVGRWLDGKIAFFDKKSDVGREAYARVETSVGGKVWLSTPTTCRLFNGHGFAPVHPQDGGNVTLTAAIDGGVWVVRGGRLLHYGDNGGRTEITNLTSIGLADHVTCLLADRCGALWIGTDIGLYRWRDGTITRIQVSHPVIRSLMEDETGQLWVGTAGGGLNRVRLRYLMLRQPQDGLNREDSYSLCEDTDNRLWVSDQNLVPVRSRTSTHKEFSPVSGWPGGTIGAMAADPKDGVWIALISGRDLLHWHNGTFSAEPVNRPATAVLADHAGNVWVSTISGSLVRRHPDGTFEDQPRDRGLVDPRALAEDATGRVWVGTESGAVFVREPNGFSPVSLPDVPEDQPVRFIVPDDEGSVWIGTGGGGLYRWRSGQVDRIPPDAGLPLENPLALAVETGGWLWLGGGRGLARFSTHEIDDLIANRINRLHPAFFGRGDGLPELEFTFGFRNSAIRTHDGSLWFATQRGALQVIPDRLPRALAAHHVLIESVQIRGVDIARSPTLRLPPEPGVIQIRYTLPWFEAPERLRFRYRLLGSGDDSWIEDEQHQRSALIPQLPPGNYRFEVTAAGDDGVWQARGTGFAITVAAAWWQTLAFRILVMALTGIVLAVLIRLILVRRMRVRLALLEQRHALDRERSRIARDMHDQVGANLTQISLMAELASSPEDVARLADSARDAAESLDNIVWAVNPGKDTLASLLQYLARFADDFLRSAGMRAQLDLPSEVPYRHLPPDFRHHVFLVAKEALNNAVKYSRATEICVRASLSPTHLTLTIEDNGVGFSLSTTSHGNGLCHLRERATALHGECLVESSPGSGTRITLSAPWPT